MHLEDRWFNAIEDIRDFILDYGDRLIVIGALIGMTAAIIYAPGCDQSFDKDPRQVTIVKEFESGNMVAEGLDGQRYHILPLGDVGDMISLRADQQWNYDLTYWSAPEGSPVLYRRQELPTNHIKGD